MFVTLNKKYTKEDEKEKDPKKVNKAQRKNKRHGTNTFRKESSKKISNNNSRRGTSSKEVNIYSKK